MKMFFLIIQLVVTILLICLILLQNSKGGLGGGLGAGEFYRSRRGAEKIVFYGTIAAAILFCLTSIATLIVR